MESGRDVSCLLGGIRTLLAAVVLLVPVGSVESAALPAPVGPVILTVEGEITNGNDDGRALLDLTMLLALPQTTVETMTKWTEGVVTFRGIAAGDLLDALGATGSRLQVMALDDYTADIPVDALRDNGGLFAITKNGQSMAGDPMGPIWIVFPWSERPELKTADFEHYSVWQVRRITVLE